ncbi:MAG TPA: DNA gyrase inhibitor YacG [Verrucomicrobiae bacterium]|nr:DNA gyrase inhibitor YacG [Verrucomicrobiae bacterium]
MQVRCPHCRRVGNWLEAKSAPFCSSRCKLLDLGKWLNQEHAISSPLREENLSQLETSGTEMTGLDGTNDTA